MGMLDFHHEISDKSTSLFLSSKTPLKYLKYFQLVNTLKREMNVVVSRDQRSPNRISMKSVQLRTRASTFAAIIK